MSFRRQKFNARKVKLDGMKFDSVMQSECYLRLRDAAAEKPSWITYECEPKFDLLPAQRLSSGATERPISYKADFAVFIKREGAAPLRVVIECKSEATRKEADYVLRRKLLLYMQSIEVVEIMSVAQLEKLLEGLRHV